MDFQSWFCLNHGPIPKAGIESVLLLSEEGSTIPFIARYRKEQTGNLDEVAIKRIIDEKESWDEILKRKKYIAEEIKKLEKLTPELQKKIELTFSIEKLEDIYLPYKKKRKTKAAKAKESGLEPFSNWIWELGRSKTVTQKIEAKALEFVNKENGVLDTEQAISGATDILIEKLAEMEHLRQAVRDRYWNSGMILSKKGKKATDNSKFHRYFDYAEPLKNLKVPQNTHRYLALRRGWLEEELVLSLGSVDGNLEAELLGMFETEALPTKNIEATPILKKVAKLALGGYVNPSIDNEIHGILKKIADEAAIHVFSENVRKLLLASPLGPKAVLGVDPGLRTGCKLALVSNAGKYLASTVMHLQSDGEMQKSKNILKELVDGKKIQAIAVGNGTAGRETEMFLRKALKELKSDVPVIMVNESGASVYSASDNAREEFPDLDITVRGAISIARRLQDPLAELVKIDPKSIGVGQYQHDVSPISLSKSLDQVVDSCVNQVGVNLNTASYHLLSHVSGIGPSLAKSVVEKRGEKGLFKTRTELLEVPKFSKKVFEQAAGFLRIKESLNPLDNTGVHPERYGILEATAKKMGKSIRDFVGSGASQFKTQPELREALGAYTFDDIIKELEKPGRDPREAFAAFSYSDEVQTVKDLKIGMILPGIVTNVTNFGAFVDVGVHQDGLVHISQLADKFVKDPREVVNPGDKVKVRVLEINLQRNQIALSMKMNTEIRTLGKEPSRTQPESPTNLRKDQPVQRQTLQGFSNNPFAGLTPSLPENKKKN